MFEKNQSPDINFSKLDPQEIDTENKQESLEGIDEKTIEVVKGELEELFSGEEVNSEEMKKTVEQVGMSPKGKIAAAFMAMTLFAGSFAGIAEAGSQRSVSDSFKIGAGRAVEDVFRGAGRGSSSGMDKAMEKTILNVFGIETREQRQDRINQERQMQRAFEQESRAYQRALEQASRENDRAIMSVLKDYQNNRITQQKKNELVKELKAMHEKKIEDLKIQYNQI